MIAPGVDLAADPEDPLVVRRAEVTRELLREGIRGLSQLERDALRLATRERLSVADVAAQLTCEPAIVEASLRSGLLNLRHSLLQQLGEA